MTTSPNHFSVRPSPEHQASNRADATVDRLAKVIDEEVGRATGDEFSYHLGGKEWTDRRVIALGNVFDELVARAGRNIAARQIAMIVLDVAPEDLGRIDDEMPR